MRPRLSYANVTSTLALLVALGGTSAYAAGLVTSGDIKDNTVRSADIANRTVKQKDVKPNSLGSQSIKRGSVARSDLADAVVSDVEWVTNVEESGSWFRANSAAVCPAGKALIGGFADVLNQDTVALHAIQYVPASETGPARVVARAHEHTATEENWTLTATAVCADVGHP